MWPIWPAIAANVTSRYRSDVRDGGGCVSTRRFQLGTGQLIEVANVRLGE